MCADQLWNLRVFWLGIPIVVLHELFVKLVQNLPKKMGDIIFWKKHKPLKICEKSQVEVVQKISEKTWMNECLRCKAQKLSVKNP